MRNRADEIRAQLEAGWPDYRVWIFWRAVGGPLWCARRRDGARPPLSFGDPDCLAWEIEQAEQD